MRRVLVLSVGTGTGPDANIVAPLIKTVQDSNPQLICFLVSAQSEVNAHSIAECLRLAKGSFQVRRLSNPEDVEATFKDALQALRALVAMGYTADEIAVDFTSGTKPMTAGLVLAATAMRCGALKYITGSRQAGIVAGGTERFLSIPPAAILAYRELELARELLLHLQFEGALNRWQAVNPALLDADGQQLHRELAHLIRAYDAWDKFDHPRFVGEYHKVDMRRPEHEPFRVGPDLPERLIAIGQAIKQKRITEDLLADLFDNAERRRQEGKFDDAVARLYRLTEMLAQRELDQFGIVTGDVDTSKVPAGLHDSFERLRDPDDRKVRIGLHNGYRLLAELGSPLGASFEQSRKLRDDLAARNESILAHGTRPISADAARRLRDAVLELARNAVGDFEQRCAELQFPWLPVAGSQPTTQG